MAIMMLCRGLDLTPFLPFQALSLHSPISVFPIPITLHIPISFSIQKKKLKFRQLEEFAQGHTARK